MSCIVRLSGGLGNQLFQYAAGRAVASRQGADLSLDLTQLNVRDGSITSRSYALSPLPIRAHVLTAEESAAAGLPLNRFDRWLARAGVRLKGRQLVVERGFNFDPSIPRLQGPVVMQGFWQSERYFADIRAVLLDELALPGAATLDEMTARLQAEESVSIHVRRGDYLTNPGANAFHGVCSPDYYQRSLALLEQQVEQPKYYVFTDDPAWVAENRGLFGRDVILVAEQLTLQAHEELVLMSRCKHNVIANSSFSWWGAWLNRNEQARVIAPANWFRHALDTTDLIPARWQRV